MSREAARIKVEACETGNVLLEKYSYSPGKVEPLPSHLHAEYQFALSLNARGEYSYRGGKLKIPAASLCVLHAGEPHAPSEDREVYQPAIYRMLYADPSEMTIVAADITGKHFAELPHFSQILISDRGLIGGFLRLFELNFAPALQLERDEARLGFFSNLILRHAQNTPPVAQFKSDAPGVRRVLEFIHDNFEQNVSLADLARASGISKFHLCRAFRRYTGVSPYIYQRHLRLSHAKKLLLRGLPIAEVSAALGFYDQSHFGQKFKNFVGISPKKYLAR